MGLDLEHKYRWTHPSLITTTNFIAAFTNKYAVLCSRMGLDRQTRSPYQGSLNSTIRTVRVYINFTCIQRDPSRSTGVNTGHKQRQVCTTAQPSRETHLDSLKTLLKILITSRRLAYTSFSGLAQGIKGTVLPVNNAN